MQFLIYIISFRTFVSQIILLFSLIILPAFCKAQLADTLKEVVENGYIERMDNYVGIKASMSNATETFNIRNNGGQNINLYPNTATYAGMSFNYRFISGGFRIAPKFLPGNGDEETQGKTKEFALGMEFIFRHFFQSIGYSGVRGYYLYNTKDYNSTWKQGDPYIQFPDLKYTGFIGSSGYSFNPRLSLKALSTQTDRQLKSTGGFIIQSKYRYYIINDKEDASPTHTKQRSDNLEINLGIGYNYVFVIKKYFYASIAVVPYIGYLRSHFKTDFYTSSTYTNQNNRILGWDSRFAVGYNGRSFFTGCNLNLGGESYRQENTAVYTDGVQLTYQFFVGYRFNPLKIMKEEVDFMQKQMEDHIPKKNKKSE
ncbi:DUF4421 family protein [Cytophaga aurantiaca]|uniref:DUF4421 family protein n=1 Tax=Cytophaga aurantiaca TaxID=29530 RepID=UPI00037A0194|nr:DUF4421 family protein [Cytophaga aurantiaca]